MPIPSPSGKEERKKFISRCVSELTKKGEGDGVSQRVAICNSRWQKSKASQIKLTEEECAELDKLISTKHYPPPEKIKKKKKNDK